MTRYRLSSVPTTEDIQQLERYLREELQRVEDSTDDIYTLAEVLILLYQVAGYGQIGLDAITPLANIGATWQQLPFDVELIAAPRRVTYNLAGDGMQIDDAGVWKFFAKVSLQFAEANQGRRLQLTLWDTFNNVAVGPLFNFAIGRNTDGANLSFTIMFEVTDTTFPIGLAVRSESDSFSSVQAIGSIFGVTSESEYQGDYFEDAGAMGVKQWQ